MEEKLRSQLGQSDAGYENGRIVDGQFRIVSCVGMGAYGTVYRAQQLTLEREVALKVLRQVAQGDEYLFGRFEREAQILSKLAHKHIVEVFSFGVDEARRCYMSMQYLQGQMLSELIQREQRLGWRRAVNIVRQICQAAEAAHKHGIVHRDLTPRNIMILQEPEPDFVKVLDFGLCGPLPDNIQSLQSLTQTGALIGSVHYMSPEVCQGGRADARSDIYSIGCILYECLSGRPPLDADEVVSVMFMQAKQMPARLREHNSDIPEDLERIVFKAMQKKPEQRFQTAADMESALQAVVAGKAPDVSLHDVDLPALGNKKSAPKRGRPILAIALVSAAIAAAVLASLTRDQWSRAFHSPPSQRLLLAEKLMNKGEYEKAFPMLLEVAHTRLNDDDANKLVGDLCDIADLTKSDNRLAREVGVISTATPWQLAMEAALQPSENRPSKFALAKAHCRAAYVLNTSSHLDAKYYQGLSDRETNFCSARRLFVQAWRAANLDYDRRRATQLYDQTLRYDDPADLVVTARCWLEKADITREANDRDQDLKKAQNLLPTLMNAPDSESGRTAVSVLATTRHDYLQIPVLESMIGRSHKVAMSHADRASLHLMLSDALKTNKPRWSLNELYVAFGERSFLLQKSAIDCDIYEAIVRAELEAGHPDKALTMAEILYNTTPHMVGNSLHAPHYRLRAIYWLAQCGKKTEAKARLLELFPTLNSRVESGQTQLDDWKNKDVSSEYYRDSLDLMDALHLLNRGNEAQAVFDRLIRTLSAQAPDEQALIPHARDNFKQSSSLQPL